MREFGGTIVGLFIRLVFLLAKCNSKLFDTI